MRLSLSFQRPGDHDLLEKDMDHPSIVNDKGLLGNLQDDPVLVPDDLRLDKGLREDLVDIVPGAGVATPFSSLAPILSPGPLIGKTTSRATLYPSFR